jgi:hypothetical protein
MWRRVFRFGNVHAWGDYDLEVDPIEPTPSQIGFLNKHVNPQTGLPSPTQSSRHSGDAVV